MDAMGDVGKLVGDARSALKPNFWTDARVHRPPFGYRGGCAAGGSANLVAMTGMLPSL
jgi:hypothetical protein